MIEDVRARWHIPQPWYTPPLAEATTKVIRTFVAQNREPALPAFPVPFFRALDFLAPADVRVVLLGQDPYPQIDARGPKANGLCFGIRDIWAYNYEPTSSFRNILDELASGIEPPPELAEGEFVLPRHLWGLEHWARQGVLMLNTRLSVAPNAPMSHAGIGWEEVIAAVLDQVPPTQPVVWLCWGAEARKIARRHADLENHIVYALSHPCKHSVWRETRFASAFRNSQCFYETNVLLSEMGAEQIDWVGADFADPQSERTD